MLFFVAAHKWIVGSDRCRSYAAQNWRNIQSVKSEQGCTWRCSRCFRFTGQL